MTSDSCSNLKSWQEGHSMRGPHFGQNIWSAIGRDHKLLDKNTKYLFGPIVLQLFCKHEKLLNC